MDDLTGIIANSPVVMLPGTYCVARLRPSSLPSRHFMVTTDSSETTVIAREEQIGELDALDIRRGYRLIEVRVATPFEGVGFLATVCRAIAEAGLNILVVSTFSADYILLQADEAEAGLDALRGVGFPIDDGGGG